MNDQPSITLSFEVYVELLKLMESMPEDMIIDQLFNEIERASLVPADQLPHDVVTMNSWVSFTVESTKKTFFYRLVYPKGIDGSENQLSVFSPVGAALIGLKKGQRIYWPISKDKETWIIVNEVS